MKIIYSATNTLNGKVYIGQTNNLTRRIREHRGHAYKDGGPFHEDIRIYGFDAFSFEILDYCDPKDADARERFYIAEYRKRLGEEMVYNYTDGGIGGQTHDMSGANNPQYHRVWTAAERKNISDKLKGRRKPEGHGAKVSAALKGVPKARSAVLKRCKPISVINEITGEILRFESQADLHRALHCCAEWVAKGGKTKDGYRMYTG